MYVLVVINVVAIIGADDHINCVNADIVINYDIICYFQHYYFNLQ